MKRISDGGGLYLLPAKDGRGRHLWRMDYTFTGLRKTLSFGPYPEVGLASAREKAATARALVYRGTDPSAKRQADRAAVLAAREAERLRDAGLPQVGSFEEVARRWYAKNESKWMDSYAPKVIRRLEMHAFPYIGAKAISAIDPPAILEVCRRVEEQGLVETAHRLLEHCSNVFRFAIPERLVPSDPCRDLRGLLKQPVSKHFAAVTNPRELAGLLRAMYAYHGTMVVRCALQLQPMLFLRPGELRQARWEEFDLDNGMWFVPSARMKRTKEQKLNGDDHFVPLPRQAVAILEELFCLTGGTGFVFPAEGRPGRTMSNGTVNAALRVLGYPADVVTGHGFRATARTLIAEVLSLDSDVVEMQLAHKVKDLNGNAYNRTEFILKRQSTMQAWADYLDELREDRADHRRHAALPAFTPVTSRLAA